jgi:hypothetical protein
LLAAWVGVGTFKKGEKMASRKKEKPEEEMLKPEDINIPDFIALVSRQVREAAERDKESGDAPLLALDGLQLEIAFTAEQARKGEVGVELKPLVIFGAKAGRETEQRKQAAHTVTLNLSPVPAPAEEGPLTGSESPEPTDISVEDVMEEAPRKLEARTLSLARPSLL